MQKKADLSPRQFDLKNKFPRVLIACAECMIFREEKNLKKLFTNNELAILLSVSDLGFHHCSRWLDLEVEPWQEIYYRLTIILDEPRFVAYKESLLAKTQELTMSECFALMYMASESPMSVVFKPTKAKAKRAVKKKQKSKKKSVPKLK